MLDITELESLLRDGIISRYPFQFLHTVLQRIDQHVEFELVARVQLREFEDGEAVDGDLVVGVVVAEFDLDSGG